MNKLRILAFVALLGLSACSWLPSWLGGAVEEKEKLPGERSAVLLADTALKADEQLAALPSNIPEPTPNADWPQHAGGAFAQIGNLALQGDLSHRDEAEAGKGEAFRHTQVSPPVVAEGMVFAMDAAGHISAHKAEKIGDVLWTSAAAADGSDKDLLGGGLAYADGVVYATSGKGLVVALDIRDGRERWRQALGLPLRASPKLADGKLYVLSVDNQTFALDVKDGNILWNHRGLSENSGYFTAVSPAAGQGVVIVPYSSGELHVLRADDGESLWDDTLTAGKRTQATAVFYGVGGDPVVEGSTLYAVSSSGLLAAFSTSRGQRIWEQPVSSLNTPWLAGDSLFALTVDNTLVCLNAADGRIRWTTPLPRFGDEKRHLYPLTWKGPVLAGGALLLAGAQGELLRVNPATGSIDQRVEIPEDVFTAPVVAGGVIYLETKDAKLLAIY